jgi:iron complex outermembrane recepter protein
MGAVMFQSFARLHALWLMFLVFAVAWSFPATKGLAQAVAAVSPEAQSVPEIVVTATRPVKPRHKHAQAKGSQPTTQTAASTDSNGGDGSNSGQPALQQVPSLGKTGTPIGNIPQSIVIVPSKLIKEQGGTSVTDVVRDVSGLNIGGTSTYGFFDRFTIRGLDARIYTDGFPDGDQSNGFPHSLNGVSRIEVLKGPGSALFGTGPPGGTVNIVHFLPSTIPAYGMSTQVGSFGSWYTNLFATGATTLPGLAYRVDGWLQHADGFRQLESANYEFRPAFRWNADNHDTIVAFDVRRIERTPDSYGIVYFNGPPIASVPSTTRYSTPFSFGDQDVERITLTDAWWWSNYVTVNDRVSYLHRDVTIQRNSGGTISGIMLTARQLRQQTDNDNDLTYQFEPVSKFYTGQVGHTLLTGTQVEWQSINDNRATADLPNIGNVFAPVIPETSTNGLTFLRDAKHSGMVDDLRAWFLSAYVTDQIDVTEQWKVRLGVRQDYWLETLAPQVFVPGRVDFNNNPIEPGTTQREIDTPFSWSAGTLYKVFPWLAPFAGVSKSYLTNFNSEATSQGLVAPESGLEYEAGVKLSTTDGRVVLTTAAFKIQRTNVFTENTAVVPLQIAFNAQESRGVDADLQVQITPQWKLLANGIVQQAVLTAVPLTPSQVGNQPVGVPPKIFNLWTTYDFAIAGINGFRVGGGLSYNDKSFANTANSGWIPPSTVFDGMVGYYSLHWDVQFGVKNIGNITYYTFAESAGGYVGDPRTYYVKANWRH